MPITTATLGIEVTARGTRETADQIERVNQAVQRVATTTRTSTAAIQSLQKSVSGLYNSAQAASVVLMVFGGERMQQITIASMAATNAVNSLKYAAEAAGISLAAAAVRMGAFVAAAAAVGMLASSILGRYETDIADAEELSQILDDRLRRLNEEKARRDQERAKIPQQREQALRFQREYSATTLSFLHAYIPLETRRLQIETQHKDLVALYTDLLREGLITEEQRRQKIMEPDIERMRALIQLRQEELAIIQSRWDITDLRRRQEMARLGVQPELLGPDPLSWAQTFRAAMIDIVDAWGGLAAQMAGAFRSAWESAIASISDGITGLIVGTRTWAQALSQIGLGILQHIVHSIVQIGVRWVATQLLVATVGRSLLAGALATAAPAAAAAAAQWTPAAIAASTATMGGAAIAGAAALTNAAASTAPVMAALSAVALPGYQSGGYTGAGPDNRPAGIVHAGEWVMPASAVRAWGHDVMAAIQAGPQNMPRMEPRIHIYFDREAWVRASRDDIEAIAVDAFRRRII